MSDKKTFAVAMLGIPANECNVLKNIFKLSAYRTHIYVPASIGEPFQIVIVDTDDADAMATWRDLPKSTAGSSFPTVAVIQGSASSDFPHFIRRPFVATRVLSMLDQVAKQLDADTPQERSIGIENPAETTPADTAATFTALVVDDSSTIRTQVEIELKLLGIQADTVESGEQAFERLERQEYDIIFLDVVLPGADGYQICKTIKRNKQKKKTPVIMLTGKSSPFDRVKGALAGCDTYLTKPVKQSSFQKTIRKYLKPQ